MQADTRSPQPSRGPDGSANGRPENVDRPKPPHADEHAVPDDLPPVSGGGIVLVVVVVLVLFGALFAIGWFPHSKKQTEAKNEAAEQQGAKPIVEVVKPKRSNGSFDLVLPGDVRANQSTSIYARTNGYLKQLPPGIDVGAKVKAGQLIAEISAPEIDAQLEGSKASLEQAKVVVGRATNEFNFNKATFERFTGLSQTGGVTGQQLDEKRSAFNIATSSLKAAQANVLAAEASVKQYAELQSFQKVVAPFDGVVTARNYDAGALISTANSAAGKELFKVEQTDVLRAYVNVPQTNVTDVKIGQEAELLVRDGERADVPFKGKVARTTGAVNMATRTMSVQVDVPNPDYKLVPGLYGQVRFKIKQERPAIVLPTSAMVFGAEGMRVAVLEDGDKIKFKAVTIGRDFGSEAEIATGLTGDERVVANPGERLVDGVEVQVAAAKAADPAHQQANPAAPKPDGKPQASAGEK